MNRFADRVSCRPLGGSNPEPLVAGSPTTSSTLAHYPASSECSGPRSPLTLFSADVDSLPVHGVHDLDVHLQLVEGEQHPLAAVGTAAQVDQVDLWSRGG